MKRKAIERKEIERMLEKMNAYYKKQLEEARQQKLETSELLLMGRMGAIEEISRELQYLNPEN